uniref:Culmination specific protein 45D n=1 Tax=Dictyostelium discoideum TaxID=44689 RepID=Q9U447_DICDI|nr:culmination specific protein 45D [Dictyostelium discoideum]
MDMVNMVGAISTMKSRLVKKNSTKNKRNLRNSYLSCTLSLPSNKNCINVHKKKKKK